METYTVITREGEPVVVTGSEKLNSNDVVVGFYPTKGTASAAVERLNRYAEIAKETHNYALFAYAIKQERQYSQNMMNAYRLARGQWQKQVVLGETTFGSELKGKAKQFGGRYGKSAENLVRRLRDNGVQFRIQFGPRGGLYSARIVLKEWWNNEHAV